jgi:hypothetical protein
MESKMFDPLQLATEVAETCQSSELTRKLLSEGNTLYGINPDYPNFIERICPDGQISIGQWLGGQFIVKFNILEPLNTMCNR